MICVLFVFFFFFKQKTAYEMRISDWSSDVCSSDLRRCSRRISHPFAIAIAPSSADLPRHGAAAACALSPSNVYSTLTMPVPFGRPQLVASWLLTWLQIVASTSLNTPARTKRALPPSSSSATPRAEEHTSELQSL